MLMALSRWWIVLAGCVVVWGGLLASKAPAALVQASVFADDTAHEDVQLPGGVASANASFESRTAVAVADSVRGKLKAYAVCDQDWRVAGADAMVRDTVTYHGPAAMLEFHLTVEGTYCIGDRFSKSHYAASVGYGLDGSGSASVWIEEIEGGTSGATVFTLKGYRWTTDGETFPLDYSLSVSVKDQGEANFGSTATLNFILPQDAYVTSTAGYDSRVIPEPACLSLLALGGVGLFRRRGK